MCEWKRIPLCVYALYVRVHVNMYKSFRDWTPATTNWKFDTHRTDENPLLSISSLLQETFCNKVAVCMARKEGIKINVQRIVFQSIATDVFFHKQRK